MFSKLTRLTGSWQDRPAVSRASVAGGAPHLGAPGRGGSSHPSQAGGPGCQERPAPAGPSRRQCREGGRGAAGPMGGAAAGRGGRGRRERGAEPGAAAAVNKMQGWRWGGEWGGGGDKTEDKWVGWEVNP